MVNGRKEFFNVTLEEIEAVVKENHDKTVEFTYFPEAVFASGVTNRQMSGVCSQK